MASIIFVHGTGVREPGLLQQRQVTSLHLDRGYRGDDLMPDDAAQGAAILCQPWPAL